MKHNTEALAQQTAANRQARDNKRARDAAREMEVKVDIEACKYWESQGFIRYHVRYGLDSELEQVKISGVPVVHTRKDTWIPKWVQDGINTFNNEGGFAGLTLAQFLAKLNNK